MIDFWNRFLAGLGVVGQVVIVLIALFALVALVVPAARGAFTAFRRLMAPAAMWLAWAVAAVATGGSLYFSEFAHFIPCQLCWYQRICMYPLVVTLFVGAVLRDRRGWLYSALFPVVGAAIAIRHIYVELNPGAESAACKIGAPCSTKWIEEFGYVTIPVLALTGFVLIGILLAFAARPPRAAAPAA